LKKLDSFSTGGEGVVHARGICGDRILQGVGHN